MSLLPEKMKPEIVVQASYCHQWVACRLSRVEARIVELRWKFVRFSARGKIPIPDSLKRVARHPQQATLENLDTTIQRYASQT